MRNYLEIITGVSMTMLTLSATPEHLRKKALLWKDAKEKYPQNYALLKGRAIWFASTLPGAFGRWVIRTAYRISRRVFGFN